MSISWKFAIWQVIVLRLLTLTAAVIGLNYLAFKPSFPYWDSVLQTFGHPLFWSWANFDGVHYLMVSEKGYVFGLTQAFFPLYIVLTKVGAFIVQNRVIAGLALSHLFFVGSLVIFYKLLRLDYSQKVTHRTILYLVLFPTSFYFLSVYTESLFLFLLLLSFYFMRTKQWGYAALVGIALTLTRIIGIFIVPAYLYEVWKSKAAQDKYPPFSHLILACVPVLGLLAYMLYLHVEFNDPLLFAHVQSSFGAGRETDKLVLIYQVFWRYLKMVFTVDRSNPLYFTVWLELLSTLSFVGLLIWGFLKKVRTSYLIFSIPGLLLPTLTGTLSSMPRYVLVLFPGFIVLGMIKHKWVQSLLVIIFTILLMICTALFTRGYWIA